MVALAARSVSSKIAVLVVTAISLRAMQRQLSSTHRFPIDNDFDSNNLKSATVSWSSPSAIVSQHNNNDPSAQQQEKHRRKEHFISYKLKKNPLGVHRMDCPHCSDGRYLCGTPPMDNYMDRRLTFKPNSAFAQAFDFTTEIETDLNILVSGDSVAVQMGRFFQAHAGRPGNDTNTGLVNVDLDLDGIEESPLLAVTTNVRGGGSIGYWRILKLLQWKFAGRSLPNKGSGFRVEHATIALDYTEQTRSKPLTKATKTAAGYDNYNVVVFRLSAPWLFYHELTNESLTEHIQIFSELYRPETMIFIPPHFHNNVVSRQRQWQNEECGRRIRKFAESYVPAPESSVQNVLVVDFDKFVMDLIEANAIELGMNMSDPEYYAIKLKYDLSDRPPQSIAQVCAEQPKPRFMSSGKFGWRYGGHDCTRNWMFNDGLHPCMETIGSRLYAAIACLLQCTYDKGGASTRESNESLRTCESGCNEKFMSIKPIPIDELE